MARTFMPAFDVARTHTEGRMGTLRKVATWLLGATMACIFVYGLVRFPDSPIHPCAEHGYCGKQGQPHTEQDFRAFSQWDGLMSYWPVGIIALIVLQGGVRLKWGKDRSSV
ncbi:hypothetical protein [Dyella kyungheensis]|uniref:DUF2752 domain-containing protein n=1 Tax=Dyella kyungheensis TaxID=1242174 RepID=A0ABS2JXD1_9GAMM|nr:hypothetical protein [Dyella kyungheensis]MBM7123682.1 hypothetical protein [Dyella kyungheensis]